MSDQNNTTQSIVHQKKVDWNALFQGITAVAAVIAVGLTIFGVWSGLASITIARNSLDAAIKAYNEDQGQHKTDVTLQYIQPLQTPEYVDALWKLSVFLQCHENKKGVLVSYLPFSRVTEPENLRRVGPVIADFFDVVENDYRRSYCDKDKYFGEDYLAMEIKLNVVYQALEGLASCMEIGLCNKDQVVEEIDDEECKRISERDEKLASGTLHGLNVQKRLIESFDYQTILSVSNYFLLARGRSKEWDSAAGNLPKLIERIERYAHCVGYVEENAPEFHELRKYEPPLEK